MEQMRGGGTVVKQMCGGGTAVECICGWGSGGAHVWDLQWWQSCSGGAMLERIYWNWSGRSGGQEVQM